jgi:phosphoglycerate dehydrogenase-like enzyme
VAICRGYYVLGAGILGFLSSNGSKNCDNGGNLQKKWMTSYDKEPFVKKIQFFRLPNCVLIPHIGSATVDTRTRMATLTAENLIAGINGQKMPEQLVESNLSTNQ